MCTTQQLRSRQFVLPILTLGFVLLVSYGVLHRSALCSWIGSSLIRSQTPHSADLILVLGGDFYGPRVLKAAELQSQHYGPLVLISGPPYQEGRPEGEFAIRFLVTQGYSEKSFAVFAHTARSTVQEAIDLAPELRRRHVESAILVTSAYHSRRAYLAMWVFCPGVHFISVPATDRHYNPERWWDDPSSRSLFWSEWAKIFGTVLIEYPKYQLSRVIH